MDEEVLDSPLDLSIPRSDAALLSNAGGLQSNNSFSWSGMAEALSWSDQLLRVKSVMTIAQLNQDWKDEEEVQEEDDQQPWRFDGQFEAFKPLEEEVEDVVGEEGVTIAESRSLEVGQEFHIFGGEEERSPIATKHFRERAEDIGKPGLRAIPPSDAVGGEESPPVCLEECSVELEAVFPAPQVSDQSVGPADLSAKEASRSDCSVGDATVQDNTLSHIADAEGELPAHHEDLSIHNTGGQQQPKKFLSPGGEEHDGGKMQIRLVKKVKVQLAKLPREDVERLMVQKDDSVAKFPRKEKKLSIQTEVVENAAANPRMRELCNFMEVLGEEDHVEMGDENLNNEAPLKRGSGGVQELLDSWEDWESGAASVSLEVPWRAVESERFGGFDFPKVDSMLVTDDGDKTALVMSHDGDESEHMTSELDPSSLLNCMELTLFGGEGQLKRGASRSPGLRN